MAEIPVERKHGAPGWLWPVILIGALGLAGLIFYLVSRDGRETASTAPAPTTQAAQQPGTPGGAALGAQAITDVNYLTSQTDKAALAGRRVQLSSVTVQRVMSDRVFSVGSGAGQEMFVILDEKLDRGGAEQIVAVKPGQVLSLSGVIERAPSAETASERTRGLNAAEAGAIKDQQVYLLAQAIRGAQ